MNEGSDRADRVAIQAVCLGCACHCDDVAFRVQDGRIVEASPPCAARDEWLSHALEDRPSRVIDSSPAQLTLEQGLDRAAALLASAVAPSMWDLETLSCEAQALALDLAARVGASIGEPVWSNSTSRYLAQLRTGCTTASWGEVRARADLVLFWGFDPFDRAPRLWERFIDPPGRFIPDGRAGRTVLMVFEEAFSHRWPSTLSRCDGGLYLNQSDDLGFFDELREIEILWVLRALVRGQQLPSERIESATGLGAAGLRSWADQLRQSRYSAIVLDGYCSNFVGTQATAEALFGLVQDLNEEGRCILIDLYSPADSTLSRRAGAPCAVDFAGGSARFLPGDADLVEGRGRESDVFINFSSGGHPALDVRSDVADFVTIPLAEPGLEANGTVMRSDEVALRVAALIPTSRPTAEAVLTALLARLDAMPGKP